MKTDNDNSNNSNTTPLLLCPDCRIQIPFISFSKSKGGIELTYKCFCSSEAKRIKLEHYLALITKKQQPRSQPICSALSHLTQNANNYCLNCNKWLCEVCSKRHSSSSQSHSLTSHELALLCSRHQASYAYYCQTCQASVCKDCLEDFSHQNHQLEEIGLINSSAFYYNCKDIDKMFQMILQTKTEFIQYIDDKIQEYNRWKETIEMEYEINWRVNSQLKELIHLILSTLEVTSKVPNYPLSYIVNSIIVAKPDEYKLDYKNPKDCYCKLRGYLKEQFVLNFIPQQTYQCLATLEGHDDWVTCLIELKDGKIASSSRDNTIKLWDLNELKCVETLKGHKDWVNAMIELDGRLMSGSGDQTIKIWDLISLECIQTLRGHKELVNNLIKLQDGRIASGSWDTTIKIWDINSMACIATLEKNSQMVLSLIELDKGYLASGSFNNIIEIWDIDIKKCLLTLEGHTEGVWSLLRLREGHLLSGSRNGVIKGWNMKTAKCFNTIEAHRDCIYCLINLNEGFFASGSGDQTIKIWESSTFQTNTIIEGSIKFNSSFVLKITNNLLLQGVICLLQLRNGNIASGSSEQTIKVWDY